MGVRRTECTSCIARRRRRRSQRRWPVATCKAAVSRATLLALVMEFEMCDFPFAELEPKTLRSKKLLGRDKNEAPQVSRNKHPCTQGYLCKRSSTAPV